MTALSRFLSRFEGVLAFTVAVMLSLALGALIILMTGANPLDAYISGLQTAVGTTYRALNTLTNTTVLVLTGLACSVAFNSGVWNIGVEGQLYVGGLAAAMAGLMTGLPRVVHVPLTLLTAVLAGALWASVPGLLRVTRGTNEIVVSLMMNYIAVLLTSYLVNYPFRAPGASWPETRTISLSAQLPYLYPLTRFNASFFVAVGITLIVVFVLRKTRLGYEWKMVGLNERASTIGGINPRVTMLLAVLVSGALGGLAGGLEVVGVRHRFMDAFSPGYGMTGILIALVAQNDPLRVVLVACVFALLKSGATGMELSTNVPAELSEILQTLIVFFLAAQVSLASMSKKRAA